MGPSDRAALIARAGAQEREAIFGSLCTHVTDALGKSSRDAAARAMLEVSAAIIRAQPNFDPNDVESMVTAVLTFMNARMQYGNEPSRDAAQFDAAAVLANGSFNGYVESAKLFLWLVREVVPGIQAQYVSAYSLSGAEAIEAELAKPPWQQDQDLINNPPGHAVIEIVNPETGLPFLVDPSLMESSLLGTSTRTTARFGFKATPTSYSTRATSLLLPASMAPTARAQ